MPSKKIIWSPSALLHFSGWIQFIAKDSPLAARKERNKILTAIKRLKVFPMSGRIVPEFEIMELREIVKKPIRIIYRVLAKEIHILVFHHERRELDRELF